MIERLGACQIYVARDRPARISFDAAGMTRTECLEAIRVLCSRAVVWEMTIRQ